MFKCNHCISTFNRRDNLTRHEKTHDGVRFPCVVCGKSFSYRYDCNRHLTNIHGMCIAVIFPHYQFFINIFYFFKGNVNTAQPARESVIQFAPRIIEPTPPGYIEIASNIFVPDTPPGGSKPVHLYTDDDDEICVAALDEYENDELADTTRG